MGGRPGISEPAALFYRLNRTFPGYLALWPVLSGALVMIAGRTDHKFAIDRLLVSTPLQSLGNISYALYLVHSAPARALQRCG